MPDTNSTTLYVDLDGTLVNSDLLLESLLQLIGRNFFYLFLMPLWLLKGKANFKHQIAERVELRIDLLPYNQKLLALLTSQKQQGKRLVLISASNNKFVEQLANHLGVFDSWVGSSATDNMKGARKLEKIREISGDSDFEYAGMNRQIWLSGNRPMALSLLMAAID